MIEFLDGQVIKWYTDNQAVIVIVDHGNTRLHLQSLALQIYEFAVSHNVILEMEWVPRHEKSRADQISCLVDFNDWQVQTWFFDIINCQYGSYTVDIFADNLNHKVLKFYSKYWTIGW